MLLLGSDKSGSNIVCNLRQDKLNPEGIATAPAVEEANECRMCASGSHAIKLQGDQFEFAGPQQDSLLIGKADAPLKLSEVMERLVGGNILGVIAGPSSGGRTRLFNVHAPSLLAHGPFHARLDYVLRRSLPVSVGHVIAVDDASEPLAQVIAGRAESAQVIGRNALDSIPPATQSAIVIATAVIESGRCLLDISRDLRSIAPNAPLLYLVGFSKTTAEPRREALERTLAQTVNPYPYQFIEVERMVLPFSDENNAWASELKLLINPVVTGLIPHDLQDQIGTRVSRLRKVTEPLRNDLFLTNGPHRSMRLQPGFVFWPEGIPERTHTQADVFFTVASVLQKLRANAHGAAKSAIKSNWFQQTILAPENFGRFNDDVIQASILRAAYPFEMNFADAPTDSRELGRLIRRIIAAADKERGGAAAEFLLAMATKRLRLCPSDAETVLDNGSTGISMIDFLLAVCSSQLRSPPQVA